MPTTKKKKKSKAGRKTVMTEKVLGELKSAFLYGCTDEEACLYAEIHPDSLYSYQKRNPKYTEQKAAWKQTPFLKSRQTIVKDLDQVDSAKWFLERKKKDEFGREPKGINIGGDLGKTGGVVLLPALKPKGE